MMAFRKSAVFTFFLLLVALGGDALADKLYLKSGEAKEGRKASREGAGVSRLV